MREKQIFYGPEGSNPNYDESLVPAYQLPRIFMSTDGYKKIDYDEWVRSKREEIIGLYENHIFGKSPLEKAVNYLEVDPEKIMIKSGIRVRVFNMFLTYDNSFITQFILFTPEKFQSPLPVFLGPNVLGNQSVTTLLSLPQNIELTQYSRLNGNINPPGTDSINIKGIHASRWPLKEITERGYGVITFHCGELYPDRPDGKSMSIHSLFKGIGGGDYTWGAIATWAWGMIKVLECAREIECINKDKIIAIGHSRLGKTALWAAGQDSRFAAVIANQSGEGGAAISRRKFGERVDDIVRYFPHWFTHNYSKFSGNEESMPVDSHALISLIAPRPIYIASAQDDLWSDPTGEFKGLVTASEAWRLYGLQINLPGNIPQLNQPHRGLLSYSIRSGGHGINSYDWKNFLDFSDNHLQ